MINVETKTSLVVSDIDVGLVPKTSEEISKNVASVLIDFVNILTISDEDPQDKKNKLIHSVTKTFGTDSLNKNENQVESPRA